MTERFWYGVGNALLILVLGGALAYGCLHCTTEVARWIDKTYR